MTVMPLRSTPDDLAGVPHGGGPPRSRDASGVERSDMAPVLPLPGR